VTRRQLEWRPDFRFGLQYVAVGDREDFPGQVNPPADNGEDALAIVAGIRIPVHGGRIRSGVREAQQNREARLQLLESERDRIRFEVQEALLRWESLSDRTALYRDTLIPQAEQSMSTSEAAYQTNRIAFLDLIDAERVWFQVRLAHRRVVSDAWIALADLERALGRKFPGDGETNRSEPLP
jgi:outer membrane protein TolC